MARHAPSGARASGRTVLRLRRAALRIGRRASPRSPSPRSGRRVKIEPENWTIVDGKRYPNYDDDVQAQWEEDIPGFIAEADAKFEGLLESE